MGHRGRCLVRSGPGPLRAIDRAESSVLAATRPFGQGTVRLPSVKSGSRLFHVQVFWYPGPWTYCAHSARVKDPPAEAHRDGTKFVR